MEVEVEGGGSEGGGRYCQDVKKGRVGRGERMRRYSPHQIVETVEISSWSKQQYTPYLQSPIQKYHHHHHRNKTYSDLRNLFD